MATDWELIADELAVRLPTERDLFEELGRQQRGDNAFPEDLIEKGRQIFATASAAAKGICDDPKIRLLIQDSGPRTSEVMTIVPLLLNLLPSGALNDTSVALVALLIARMGLGTFCASRRRP